MYEKTSQGAASRMKFSYEKTPINQSNFAANLFRRLGTEAGCYGSLWSDWLKLLINFVICTLLISCVIWFLLTGYSAWWYYYQSYILCLHLRHCYWIWSRCFLVSSFRWGIAYGSDKMHVLWKTFISWFKSCMDHYILRIIMVRVSSLNFFTTFTYVEVKVPYELHYYVNPINNLHQTIFCWHIQMCMILSSDILLYFEKKIRSHVCYCGKEIPLI